MKLYLFGVLPLQLHCGGGGGSVPQPIAPPPPPPPPPPPQLARLPDREGLRQRVDQQSAVYTAGGGGRLSTILSSGMGDVEREGKRRTLLGQ